MFNFKASKDGKAAEVYIYGVIGWDVTAKELINEIKGGAFESLTVHINSMGGEVIEGNAIFNAIKNFSGSKSAIIEGIAGSAASYVMLACDTIKAFENATVFIHNPLVDWASGNSKDLDKISEELKKFEEIYVEAYVAKSGKDADEIRILMDAETLFSAQEAKDFGLIDEVISDKSESANALKSACKMVALFNPKNFSKNSTKAELTEYKKWTDALKDLKDFLGKLEDEALKTELQGILDGLDKLAEAENAGEGGEGGGEGGDGGDDGSGAGGEQKAQIDAAVKAAVEPLMSKIEAQEKTIERFLAKGGEQKSAKFKSKSEEYRSIKDETERRAFFAKHKTAILMGK